MTAETLADVTITDPTALPCDACGARTGEACFPGCLAVADLADDLADVAPRLTLLGERLIGAALLAAAVALLLAALVHLNGRAPSETAARHLPNVPAVGTLDYDCWDDASCAATRAGYTVTDPHGTADTAPAAPAAAPAAPAAPAALRTCTAADPWAPCAAAGDIEPIVPAPGCLLAVDATGAADTYCATGTDPNQAAVPAGLRVIGDDNGDGRIDEDESGWDCPSMGNRVCGPHAPAWMRDGNPLTGPRA